MSGLVRVTVLTSGATAEVVIPSVVALAEVVPDLARSVGVLAAATAPAGYRLESPPGHPLRLDATPAEHGLGDGAVLVVRPGLSDEPPSHYDGVLPLQTSRWAGRLTRWPSARRRGWPWRRAAGWPGAARRRPSAPGVPTP